MNRLVLIDGNAILHRAFHALPPLTSPDGSPVGAVYGFILMLLKLVNDLKPTHLAVAFDRPKPTFRQEIFKDYQAQRPQMDAALVPQVDKVHEVISAFGFPIYELDGFEADDVIGTLCQKVQSKNIEQTIIVTGDRDLLQLVEDDRVLVYMPVKGLSEAKLYGEKEVKDKLGVVPRQIPDFKALAGDASDNYPGVPGVGPKTASELLTKFRSVEAILAARGELPEALRKKLKEGKESAELSKQLATVRRDAPIEVDLTKARVGSLNTPSARKVLEDLRFSSLLKRLSAGNPSATIEKKPKEEQQQLF